MKKLVTGTSLMLLTLGCARYTQSKIELTSQAQTGLTNVRHSLVAQRQRQAAASDALQQQLDAAFDQDVASRDALTPAWVIAHRKAYTTAVKAYAAQRRAADATDAATLGTLDAVASVLEQLQQMHATELQLTLPEVKR